MDRVAHWQASVGAQPSHAPSSSSSGGGGGGHTGMKGRKRGHIGLGQAAVCVVGVALVTWQWGTAVGQPVDDAGDPISHWSDEDAAEHPLRLLKFAAAVDLLEQAGYATPFLRQLLHRGKGGRGGRGGEDGDDGEDDEDDGAHGEAVQIDAAGGSHPAAAASHPGIDDLVRYIDGSADGRATGTYLDTVVDTMSVEDAWAAYLSTSRHAALGHDEAPADGARRAIQAVHALLAGNPSQPWPPALWLLAELRLFTTLPPAMFDALPPVTLRAGDWEAGDVRRRCLTRMLSDAAPVLAAVGLTAPLLPPAGKPFDVVVSFGSAPAAGAAATLAVCLADRTLESAVLHVAGAMVPSIVLPDALNDKRYAAVRAGLRAIFPIRTVWEVPDLPPIVRVPPLARQAEAMRVHGATILLPTGYIHSTLEYYVATGVIGDADNHAALATVASYGTAVLALAHLGRVRFDAAAVAAAILPNICGTPAACATAAAALHRDDAAAADADRGTGHQADGGPGILPAIHDTAPWRTKLHRAVAAAPALLAAALGTGGGGWPDARVPMADGSDGAVQPTFPAVHLYASDADAESALLVAAGSGCDFAAAAVVARGIAGLGPTYASPTDPDACYSLGSLAFRIALDATQDGDSPLVSPPLDVTPLWEANEDTAVLADAGDAGASVTMLRNMAAAGDVGANVQLGELLLSGYPPGGVVQDTEAAGAAFAAAAAGGDADAAAHVQLLAIEAADAGRSAPLNAANRSAVLAALEAAAEAGSVKALAGLGYLYQTGVQGIVPRNMTTALHYLAAAAEGGHLNAASNLAAVYLGDAAAREPWGIPFNATAAREYLNMGVAVASVVATFNLGVLEYKGWDAADGHGNCTAALALWAIVAARGRWKATTVLSEPVVFHGLATAVASPPLAPGALDAALRADLVLAAGASLHAINDAAWLLRRLPTAAFVVDTVAAAAAPWNRSETSMTERAPGGTGVVVAGDAVPAALAAQLYAAGAALGSPFAAAELGACYAEAWPGVGFCRGGSHADGVAAATKWYTTAADAGFAHAAWALAVGALTGMLGVRPTPRNVSDAWVWLDAVEEMDDLSGYAVAAGRIAVAWQAGAATARAVVHDCWEWEGGADDDATNVMRLVSWMPFVVAAAGDELVDDDALAAQIDAIMAGMSPVVRRYMVGGVLPLTLADRQMCTVLVRTGALAAALACVIAAVALLAMLAPRRRPATPLAPPPLPT